MEAALQFNNLQWLAVGYFQHFNLNNAQMHIHKSSFPPLHSNAVIFKAGVLCSLDLHRYPHDKQVEKSNVFFDHGILMTKSKISYGGSDERQNIWEWKECWFPHSKELFIENGELECTKHWVGIEVRNCQNLSEIVSIFQNNFHKQGNCQRDRHTEEMTYWLTEGRTHDTHLSVKET